MPKSILIVDDSPSIRRLLRTWIETGTSWQICGEAADGVEAIEKARECKPDLILLDFSMPVMNGLEAATVMREIVPHAPIILFTMHANPMLTSLAYAAGIKSVLSKADQLHQLAEEIERLLDNSASASA